MREPYTPQQKPLPETFKPADVNSFVFANALTRWIAYLGGSLLFYWLFLPTLDRWMMTLLAIFKRAS